MQFLATTSGVNARHMSWQAYLTSHLLRDVEFLYLARCTVLYIKNKMKWASSACAVVPKKVDIFVSFTDTSTQTIVTYTYRNKSTYAMSTSSLHKFSS